MDTFMCQKYVSGKRRVLEYGLIFFFNSDCLEKEEEVFKKPV